MNKNQLASVLGRAAEDVFLLFPECHFPETTHPEAFSEKLPQEFDGFRIAQLSDLHGRTFGARLPNMVNAEKPDLIAMTGDLADRRTRSFGPVLGLVKTLCGICPVYFVSGNHEQGLPSARREEFLAGLRNAGAVVFDNSTCEICRGGAAIRLCGLRLPLRYYRAGTRAAKPRPALTADAVGYLVGKKSEQYTVLLAHNPLCFDAYAAWGAELTLCGHVHGGLIRLPGIGGLLSPERSFFPKYSAGTYFSGTSEMIVSRGLSAGPRIGNRPELVCATLHAGKRP